MSKRPGDPGYAPGWCIHYRRPIDNKPDGNTCEAGVDYSRFKMFATRPCFLDHGKSRPDAEPCEKRRLPTPEEIAAHETWAKDRTTRVLACMAAAIIHFDKNSSEHNAEIACPACLTGKLMIHIGRVLNAALRIVDPVGGRRGFLLVQATVRGSDSNRSRHTRRGCE